MPHVLSLNTMREMDPSELFGNECKRILSACQAAFKNWIHPYEGCYRSPARPTPGDIRKDFTGESLTAAYKAAMANWEVANPEEVSKEESSRKEWENHRNKQFRIIYGIASRHGLYLAWHGPSCGDQWTVYKCGEPLARVYCL